ncbi:MAG: glycosyltransferase family 25 protein [Hyphomicrobium sp.]|nr:glycosyltransferase family 25 protein [Hyphomicrobium sp.]
MSSAVFIINLDRSPDRLAFMQAQAERLNFNFERVRGVNGTRGLPKWLAPQFVSETGEILSKMSSGEVGCYASHLIALSRMVDRKIGPVIVLEDDVTLDTDFFTTAEAAILAAPEGWDLIHLSTRFKNPCFTVAELNGDRRLVRHSRLPAGSAAYAISISGASKLLASKVRKHPFDMEFRYAWIADLDIFGVHPAPAVDGAFLVSTIEAPWRTKLKSNRRYWERRLPKPRWAPNPLSQLWGLLLVKPALPR